MSITARKSKDSSKEKRKGRKKTWEREEGVEKKAGDRERDGKERCEKESG